MNVTNCPRCGCHVRAESIGWKCDSCRGFIDMQGNFHEHVERRFMPPMTNSDRIRAMSDEELAEFFCQEKPRNSPWCEPIGSTRCGKAPCRKCMLKWLQRPAEGE